MPGLLDDDLFNDPKKLGLLTMGLSLLSTPGRFGESFGRAGLQGVQATRGAMKDAQQSQLAKLQLDEAKQKALDAQKAREVEMRIAQTAQNFLRPPQPARPGTADLQSMMPPGTSIGAMQPIHEQRGGFDTQGFLSALPSVPGMNPLQAIETQAKYQQLLAKERPKYSTAPQFTPQGKAYLVADDGSIKWLDGQVAPRDKVISDDLGGKRIYRTEYSPTPIGEAAKSVTPDAMYSGGITMRGQNMVHSRSREQIQATRDASNTVYDPERGVLVNKATGMVISPMSGGKPLAPKEKAITDAQAKANLFGTRMKESDRIISNLEGLYSPAAVNAKMTAGDLPVLGGVAGMAGNAMLSDYGQQAEQAQRDFVNAVLRRESGAVISPSEFANAQKQYFPQPGDTKETLAQKARNRKLAISGLEVEVPGGFKGAPTLTNPQAGQSGWRVVK